ncbi:transporter [Candidatus Omnitrophota bacterium]
MTARVRGIALIMLCFCFVCIPLSFAARPLCTDDAGTVAKNEFELETGIEYVNQADKEVALCFVLKTGILDRMDLGIEVPYKFIDFQAGSKTDGFDDIILVTKYNFLQETDTLPALSVSFSFKSDSGNNDRSLGTGKREYAINSILSKSLHAITLHFNLGYVFKEDLPGEDLEDVLIYSLAMEYPLNERLNLVGDITGENECRNTFDDNSTAGLIGFNYSLTDIITYDLGVGFEISEASPDFVVRTGLTFSL